MDIISSMVITQIPYYIILFFCVREIRKIRNKNKLKIIIS